MNTKIKQKWTERLRSGDYVQGKQKLRNKEDSFDTFCCLGVLCELARDEGIVIWDDELKMYIAGEDDGNNLVLPNAVVDWAGLDDPNPITQFDEQPKYDAEWSTSLGEMNDEYNYSFEDIARVIEEQL